MTKTMHYGIDGMTCQACATRLEKVLNKKEQIQTAFVNFASESLDVTYVRGALVTEDELSLWVTKAGFRLLPSAEPMKSSGFWQGFWADNKVLTLIFALFLLNMIGMMAGHHWLFVSVQFVLASVVQFWLARHFYKSAWASIKGGLANMDVLIVLGTLTIWLYSTYVYFTLLMNNHVHHAPHEVYYEASVMVIFFISFGKYIEHYTKRVSLDSIGLMLSLVPQFVKVKTHDGYCTIATDKVVSGDVILAKQDDYVALDGVVVSGFGACDESHLTGESMPIDKRIDDKVYAGAWVKTGAFEYRALSSSKTSTLAALTQNLALAQGSKAKVARVADKVAAVFVPVVVLVALVTFGLNYWLLDDTKIALMRAVAVLVIACPCALGLATPAAIMAGMGVAARHGVWFKNASSLELSGKINTVVFDKTGTLTVGKPTIIAKHIHDGKISADVIIGIAASLEKYSNHPLAHCFIEHAKSKNIKTFAVQSPKNYAGEGICGTVVGVGVVKIGRPSFVNYPAHAVINNGVWRAATVVAMSIDDKPVAIFALADEIRQDAKMLIDTLKQDNVDLIMMSGDRQSVVDYVAQTLDIKQALGDMTPQGKAAAIWGFKNSQTAARVAMVGDGINDALAMSAADSSFAVGGASDIAKHTSDAWLTGDSLAGVYHAKKISEHTLKVIHQNLFFAFVYNIIGMALAAMGFLTPMVAAIAMTLSSICVILNALRLKRLNLA